MQRNNIALWLLIAAQVIVFGWFGIDKFLSPEIWIGWMPSWMDGLMGVPVENWLKVVGTLEMLFAVLLLMPYRRIRQVAAALIALHLMFVISQVGWNDIGVRDIGLLLGSLSLLVML